jgi:hypothetical protein
MNEPGKRCAECGAPPTETRTDESVEHVATAALVIQAYRFAAGNEAARAAEG